MVFHRRGDRERLAARPGAEVEDLHAGLGLGKQRRELRALVLHFDEAFEIGRVGGERRRAAVPAHGDAQTDRRERGRLGREVGKRGERLLARALEKVDAQIKRRPLRQRPALVGGLVAEARLELARQPFGIVSRDMRRGAGEIGSVEPSRSASVSAVGAWPSPENSAAMAAASSPRVCLSAPRISARGVDSPMIQADELFLRRAS